jgi:hypothetical protein
MLPNKMTIKEPTAPTGSVVERLTAPARPSPRSSALAPPHRQRPMRQRLLHLAQGDFKHR